MGNGHTSLATRRADSGDPRPLTYISLNEIHMNEERKTNTCYSWRKDMAKFTLVIALMALLPASQALAQSSGEPATPKSQGAGSGTEPGGMGSTGETGGAADKVATPPPSYRSPVATGLDLKGPTRTE